MSDFKIEGENGMTDLQFKYLLELQEKCKSLEAEVAALQGSPTEPSGMTDLQFYKAARDAWDKREAELLREIERLRGNSSSCSDEGMTDYQFKRYNEERDKREALEKENAILRAENDELKRSAGQ